MNNYFKMVASLDHLSRLFKDLVDVNLDEHDITPTEIIILCNMRDQTYKTNEVCSLNIYAGTNAQYLITKMKKNGYLQDVDFPKDRRITHIRMTEKGLGLRKKMLDLFEADQPPFLHELVGNLRELEWWLGKEIAVATSIANTEG